MILGEREFARQIDVKLLLTVLALTACGLLAIYSATHLAESPAAQQKFTRQLLWATLGLMVLLTTAFSPLRLFYKHAYTLYAFSLFALVLVLLVGKGAGARRWLTLGPIWLQPSEFAKVATVLALARFLSQEHRNLRNIRDVTLAFSLAFLPLALIIRQPDLGTSLVFLALILPILHWAGLSPVVLFVLLAPALSLVCAFNYYTFFAAMLLISGVLLFLRRGMAFFLANFSLNVGVGVLTPIAWNLLKGYQKNRILTFLGLVSDPHGLGYQVIQSKVAIGSGGLLGKGFLAGTQTHLRFLPEQHTDFIFCVIAEEFGFLGVLVVLSLFAYLVIKGFQIAMSVKSRFSSLVVFGAAVVFLFEIFVNMGMTVGIMPVTGLPLPFLSYGGSSLLSGMVFAGLMLNASRKRFAYI